MRGGVGGGSGLGKRGGGVSWVRGASTGVQATTSMVSPPMRQTRPRRVTVHRGGSSGEVMPLGAGRVLLHVGAAVTVVPVPLATGSWGTLLSGLPLTGSPIIVPRDVSECVWWGVGGGGEGKDVTGTERGGRSVLGLAPFCAAASLGIL